MSLVRHFPRNDKGRDFVVGDIHGHPDLLRQLLRMAKFEPATDRVFSVGDLIDRGPDSVGALALLDEPWFHAVRGNHELMLLHTVTGEMAPTMWLVNGGRWGLDLEAEALVAYAQKIQQLPLVIVVGEGPTRFNVLHAETYLKDEQLDRGEFTPNEAQRMVWGRSIIQGASAGFDFDQEGLSQTFVGHTVRQDVHAIGSHTYLDTGVYLQRGGLTLVEPALKTFWYVRNPQAEVLGW